MVNLKAHACHGSWICVLILCSSMGWTRSLCLSALPSTWRGNQNGYRCSSSALPICGWRFCDALSDRCFSGGSLFLCVSLPGPEAVRSWSHFSIFPDGSGLYSLPGLETLHCRVYCTCTADEICTCTADDICTSTVFWSLHLHCQLIFTSTVFWSVPNKDSVFTRNWISIGWTTCLSPTVTQMSVSPNQNPCRWADPVFPWRRSGGGATRVFACIAELLGTSQHSVP